jgi:membrane protease YdiL (CAAX protease family)
MEPNTTPLPIKNGSPEVTPANVVAAKTFVAGLPHTLFLLLVLFAWTAWGVIGAHRMRQTPHPNRAALYLLTIFWEWLMVLYIAWGVRRHGSSLRQVVGGAWKSVGDFLRDVATAAAFWIVAMFVLGFVARVLHLTRTNENTRFMLPQSKLEIILWIFASMTAGVTEEIIFRGYLQKQFIAWTSNVTAGILLSAMAFGAGHLYQSWKPALVIGVYGVLFGVLAQKRNTLRPGMMAHAWHDAFTGLVMKLVRQ